MASGSRTSRILGRTAVAALVVTLAGVTGVSDPGLASAASHPTPAAARVIPLAGRERRPAPPHRAATSLLVRYRPGTGAARRSGSRSRANVALERGRGTAHLEVVRPSPGTTLEAALEALRADPAVELAEPNAPLELAGNPADEPDRATYQWGLENTGGSCFGPQTDLRCANDVDIDAIGGWASATGAGVTVAVLDDGLDFSQSELATQAWVNPGESGPDGKGGDRATNGIDDDGDGFVDDVNGANLCAAAGPATQLHEPGVDWHGTAVASVIGAATNGEHIAGVAPDVRLMAVRWLVKGSCEDTSDAIRAIEYAVARGADVINASWGGYQGSQALADAIAAAGRAGVLVVAAAGNGATTDPFYPAAYDASNVVSVAAIGPDGGLAPFSNRGPTVDVAAPGVDIRVPCVGPSSVCPTAWEQLSGTSFAAPFATGVAALALEVRPDLRTNVGALRARLLESGWRDAGLPAGSTATGRVVDAQYAVDTVPPSAPDVTIRAPVGTTIGSASAAMTVSWTAATDDTGIDSYAVRYRPSGGTSWTIVTSSTTGRTARVTLAYDRTYELEVTARDRGTNTATRSLTVTPRLYSESSSAIAYRGAWTLVYSSRYCGGKLRAASVAGRSATLSIVGRSASWVSELGPTRGAARIYVDGSYRATISLHAASTSYRRVVWAITWPAVGRHTVRIVVVGTSGHPRVDVDGFVVDR